MIDILLSVYNGEKYLRQQLDSLLAQDIGGWRVLVRDDGSSDSSPEIIREYAQKHPGRIAAVGGDAPSGSARDGFFRLMGYASGDYIMFCDQDDVWLPDKIRRTYFAMKHMERDCGADTPLLVHTELIVSDMKTGKCFDSFTQYQGLDPRAKSLSRLLCQNNVTGCTVMINRALLSLCLAGDIDAVREDILMHDWWLALLAAACGKIGFVRRPTILYRQHGNNTLGAVRTGSLPYIFSVLKKRRESAGRVKRTFTQADALLLAYGERIERESREVIVRYLDIPGMEKPQRIAALLKGGYKKQSTLHLIGQLVFS